MKSSIKQPPANFAVPLDPKAAAQTDYTGHYSNSSLRPVSNYVQRPALHQQLKEQLHDKITETNSVPKILVVRGLGGRENHSSSSITFKNIVTTIQQPSGSKLDRGNPSIETSCRYISCSMVYGRQKGKK